MKFLCDQMLVRLGRWLRAAGYDTEIASPSFTDKQIMDQAIRDNRLLLTRDSHILEMKESEKYVIWLRSNNVEECVKELNSKLHINWLYKTFSRCLLCNFPLSNPPNHSLSQVPEDVKERSKQFWYCENCKKVYWEGSHTSRMLKKLQS